VRSIVRPAALVQSWLDTLRPDQQETAQALHDAVLAAEPALTRTIKWGNLMFMHHGAHAVSVVVHKAHANLQVFNGAMLAARFQALEGIGKGMRHLKFSYTQPVDPSLVADVVRACIQQMGSAAE
jgi:uncharacterized protein YdhG (YjbR/CyaY superfamily)